ncbi:beta-like DNA polymerase [Vibrio phage 1.031.O._10N.261.46.F8]|nr:beta-like DNA polymerase [Vibrio phage 1.031.O._10N.261.46.F8]
MAIQNLNNPANEGVIQHLIDIGTLYQGTGDKRKSTTFFNVSMILRGVADVIDKDYDVTKHQRVGGSTQREVTQFLETGTSDRKEELRSAKGAQDDNTPLPERVASELANHSGGHLQVYKVGIIMTVAVNGLQTLEDYKANVDKFDQHVIDAGLEVVLDKLINK